MDQVRFQALRSCVGAMKFVGWGGCSPWTDLPPWAQGQGWLSSLRWMRQCNDHECVGGGSGLGGGPGHGTGFEGVDKVWIERQSRNGGEMTGR